MKKPANKKRKIYYKVVRETPSGIWSAIPYGPGRSVKYEVGKPARPKIPGSPLFVFASLADAERFALNNSSPTCFGTIYECLAGGVRKKDLVMMKDSRLAKDAYIRVFWKKLDELRKSRGSTDSSTTWRIGFLNRFRVSSPPDGTVLARTVTLLKRVARDVQLR